MKHDWQQLLTSEWEKSYFLQLKDFLDSEYEDEVVCPLKDEIFNAFKYTGFAETKVVILGQDPYHGLGQAHGLSFSVQPDVKIPPSLKNIYKELEADVGCTIPNNGYLLKWAKQGVLLLNTVLTVRKGAAHSHRKKGWEPFTNEVIRLLNEREDPVIFVLWGKPAQEKLTLIDTERHPIIKSPHPSPFSARTGFFGSKPFSEINRLLRSNGNEPIDWQIDNK
ncbi:uracil-DNA glycosylase [Cytobacillus purgationiresistens]|uniref:Uracil-DNA glycosylase n=1 Tax=Cytobacillus purgationiresistens TaxID=863449 RepID=A0ABU0AKI9_9BACI|nr:uracil-DNA glycosylase [Cytobacillus purgationiresistens]MDQ0271780.1 uracil-DNA glycosylase [Cytobacillus purgationiresistens]